MQTIARTVPPSNEDKHFWISMATRNLQVRISSEGLMWSKRFWLGINHSWTEAAFTDRNNKSPSVSTGRWTEEPIIREPSFSI